LPGLAFLLLNPLDPGCRRVLRLGQEVALCQHKENGQPGDVALPPSAFFEQVEEATKLRKVRLDLASIRRCIDHQDEGIRLEDLAGETVFRAARLKRRPAREEIICRS